MLQDQTLHFGPYRLAGPHGPLWQDTKVVPLPPKALAVLWELARQTGKVITKEALLALAWGETNVHEGVLTACLRTLRRALGEDARQPKYIATVHRLGYRFVALVNTLAPQPPAQPWVAPGACPSAVPSRPTPPSWPGVRLRSPACTPV